MKFHYLLLLPCLACAGYAHAEIYKRVDADGNVTYSNTPFHGGKKVELEPLPTLRSYSEPDAHYKRVKPTTQQNRDAARRKVLEGELAAEQTLLVEARHKLQETQDRPPLLRVAGHADDVRNAQEQVELHERNITAIKQELSSIN
jgi:hypothetical protein